VNESNAFWKVSLETKFPHVTDYFKQLRAGRSGDRIPVGARFSAPVQTGPGAYQSSCTMCTGSFPGVKRPGRGVDHPPPSSARVKERVELYLYSPSGPSWPVLGRSLPLPLPYVYLPFIVLCVELCVSNIQNGVVSLYRLKFGLSVHFMRGGVMGAFQLFIIIHQTNTNTIRPKI
jgi:hypothetical protein